MFFLNGAGLVLQITKLSNVRVDPLVFKKQALDIERADFEDALAALQNKFKAQCYL